MAVNVPVNRGVLYRIQGLALNDIFLRSISSNRVRIVTVDVDIPQRFSSMTAGKQCWRSITNVFDPVKFNRRRLDSWRLSFCKAFSTRHILVDTPRMRFA
jgi:hypothetical protein